MKLTGKTVYGRNGPCTPPACLTSSALHTQADYKGKERMKGRGDVWMNMESAEGLGRPAAAGAEIEWPSVVLNVLLYLVTALLLLPFSFFTVEPQEHALVLFWGSLVKVVK